MYSHIYSVILLNFVLVFLPLADLLAYLHLYRFLFVVLCHLGSAVCQSSYQTDMLCYAMLRICTENGILIIMVIMIVIKFFNESCQMQLNMIHTGTRNTLAPSECEIAACIFFETLEYERMSHICRQ